MTITVTPIKPSGKICPACAHPLVLVEKEEKLVCLNCGHVQSSEEGTRMVLEGIPSGDLECWCLLVTKETFKRVTGHKPDESFDVGHFAQKGSPYRYKVYPNSLIKEDQVQKHKEVLVISIEVTKKKKEKK